MQTSKKRYGLPAVVDTNILIRALLNPTSSDGKIYKMFLSSEIILYSSEGQLKEINRVLRYPRIKKKYGLSDDIISDFISTIVSFGKLVITTERIELSRDKDDNELLSIAKSVFQGDPIYLITADEDLLVLKGKMEGIRILTPQEFLRQLF